MALGPGRRGRATPGTPAMRALRRSCSARQRRQAASSPAICGRSTAARSSSIRALRLGASQRGASNASAGGAAPCRPWSMQEPDRSTARAMKPSSEEVSRPPSPELRCL